MRIAPTVFSRLMVPGIVVGLMVAAGTMQAQPPRQGGYGQNPYTPRAQQACDAAASRYGYQVLRRDRENVNGNTYNVPMRVNHGGTQADVTCQYDTQRGVAMIPRWDDQNRRPGDYDRGDRDRGDRDRGNRDRDDRGRLNQGNGEYAGMDQQAASMCQNYVSQRGGYQVVSVGAAIQHGRKQFDVPVTVRRNGRRETTVTCRYNAANNRVSLR